MQMLERGTMIRMTADTIAIKGLLAQLGNATGVFRNIVVDEGKEIYKLYGKTYSTWDEKPNFITEFKVNKQRAETTVWTEHDHYWFVHEGVKKMRAVFSDGWVAKTQPGVLHSSEGSGEFLYASKKIDGTPYKPRKFTSEIISQRQEKFIKAAREKLEKYAVGVRKAP